MEEKRLTVFVIDDDEQVVRSLRRRLGIYEFRWRAATDLRSALDEIARDSPDVVMLDVYLGEENGLDHIAAIRAAGFAGPLIVLSGDASFATAHRAAIAGADGYVVKGEFGVIPDLVRCLEPRSNSSGPAPDSLPDAAIAYLSTRGLRAEELGLALQLAHDGASEQEIAARTGLGETEVRAGFEAIRKKLDAKTQSDLARMIGVLSCFGGTR